MLRMVGLKLAYLVPVMFVVSLATFFILEAVPGDPAVTVAGVNADPAIVAEIRAELGLDQPVIQRYFDWLGGVLTGDLGRQLLTPRLPVSTVIKAALPVTLEIAGLALVMALLAAIPAALVAASRPGDAPDRALSTSAFGVIAIPSFLMALLLIFLFIFNQGLAQALLFAVALIAACYLANRIWRTAKRYPPGAKTPYLIRRGLALVVGLAVASGLILMLPDFPRQGFVRLSSGEGIRENLKSAFLPALTLASIEAAVWMRLLRGDLVSTLQEDFILASRAKGMPALAHPDARRAASLDVLADHRARGLDRTADRRHRDRRADLQPARARLVDGAIDPGQRRSCCAGSGAADRRDLRDRERGRRHRVRVSRPEDSSRPCLTSSRSSTSSTSRSPRGRDAACGRPWSGTASPGVWRCSRWAGSRCGGHWTS